MATYRRYSKEDVTKAITAIDKGYDAAWAARRYGVPVRTLKQKYIEAKGNGNH